MPLISCSTDCDDSQWNHRSPSSRVFPYFESFFFRFLVKLFYRDKQSCACHVLVWRASNHFNFFSCPKSQHKTIDVFWLGMCISDAQGYMALNCAHSKPSIRLVTCLNERLCYISKLLSSHELSPRHDVLPSPLAPPASAPSSPASENKTFLYGQVNFCSLCMAVHPHLGYGRGPVSCQSSSLQRAARREYT